MSSFIGVRHVGLAAKNPAALAGFYCNMMGMTVTGRSPSSEIRGSSLFLSTHPAEESHELVFFEDPKLAHIAFRVAELRDLLACYRRVREQGLPIKFTANHGNSLAFYINDPEENMIEIYWSTNLRIWQPYVQPIDLDLPEAELLREVQRVAEAFR